MAMLIAWQTVNAVRRPQSNRFTRGFLIVAPGITIKDRLRVLQPNDPDSYYASRELVPSDMLDDVNRAKIVITNYHAFKLRERTEVSKGTRAMAEGWRGEALDTLETEGVARVMDLSATPFFLRGSGYAEGTLFPWTMSDFSLMDAIECGIVKLPRVPVADNIPSAEMPMFRNLWEHIRTKMPKKGRGKADTLDPLSLPPQLQTALEALYGHYEKTYEMWDKANIRVPPCFIVVCNNTSTSKLIYDYISGFYRLNEDESTTFINGRLELFRNFNEHGNPLPRPNTLLIDSEQLESGEALDNNFRNMAADEIERFRREILDRDDKLAQELRQGKELDDVTLLREVMNTVGKYGQLGGSIRCVVSVSMLTEGWDANTVTHVLGVRAFGTQLLCEQVIRTGTASSIL
jgi:type III restriction enzyme